MIFSCSKCEQTWSSLTAAHCSECCQEGNPATFSGVTGFDQHRKVGTCLDPESLGFVLYSDMWMTPEARDNRESLTARFAESRAARKKA